MSSKLKIVLAGLLLSLAAQPHPLWACATCYGQSDAPMARGMTWGILSLLVVVTCVLGGIVSFFVFIAKRSPTDKVP